MAEPTVEPATAAGLAATLEEPPAHCPVCGARRRADDPILCPACGEPVLRGGWAP